MQGLLPFGGGGGLLPEFAAVATSLVESGGTIFTMGAVSNNQYLTTSCSSIVGVDGVSHLIETGGPTTLTMATVADQSVFYRSGTTVAGLALSSNEFIYHSGAGLSSTFRAANIATTTTLGPQVKNTTAATAGVQVQYGLAVGLGMGAGWKAGTSESITEEWCAEVRPIAVGNVISTLNFLRRQGSGGWNSVFNISSAGNLSVSGYVASANLIMWQGNLSTGQGTLNAIYTSTSGADYPIGFVHRNRTDGANNVVAQVVYDRNAAAITNAASMRLFSLAWTNNADVTTELASVRCDGSLYAKSLRASADLGGVASHVTFTNTVEGSAGAATGNYLVFYDGVTKLKLAIYADS